MPELAVQAAQRLAHLGGDPAQVRAWLLPVWGAHGRAARWPAEGLALKLIHCLEDGLSTIDAGWLAHIEAAQQANPAMRFAVPGRHGLPESGSFGARRSSC